MTFDPPVLETLRIDVMEDGILRLTINRPERMNTQTVQMFHDYLAAATALRDSGARALIVTGAGDRAFCAGFDLAEIDVLTRMGVHEFVRFIEVSTTGVAALRHLPFPVIAAIHGPASGGGLSLALAADLRLAAPTAKFNLAFAKVGLSVGELGTSWSLPRLIGSGMAAEMAFTGRVVTAEEAERIGLVNRVVPSDALLDEAVSLARQIAANSTAGVRMSKRALQRNQEVSSYAAALELESRSQGSTNPAH